MCDCSDYYPKISNCFICCNFKPITNELNFNFPHRADKLWNIQICDDCVRSMFQDYMKKKSIIEMKKYVEEFDVNFKEEITENNNG